MERKYDKNDPLPKAEYARLQRNIQRRILARKKNQTKPATIEQFERVLFEIIKSKAGKLPDLKQLQNEIGERVKELVYAENDEATAAATKLKNLFREYGLSRQDLLKAIKETDWAKHHDEILKLEVQKGVEAIAAGYYTVLETETDFENFFEQIKQRGLRRFKVRQKIKNNSVQL